MKGNGQVARPSFFADTVTIMSGTVASQLIVLLAMPIVTRLYSPADFGGVAIFSALLTAIVIVSNLRYELAIALPKTDDVAFQLFLICGVCLFSVTLVTSIVTALLSDSLVKILGVSELEKFIWLLPMGVFLCGCYRILKYWSLRMGHYGEVSRTRLIQSSATVLIQVFASPLGLPALLTAQIANKSVGIVSLSKKVNISALLRDSSTSQLWSVARRYRKFPLVSTWGDLAMVAANHMPVVLIASLYDAATAGFYFLAQRATRLPVRVFGLAVAEVFLPQGAKLSHEGKIAELTEKTFLTISAIAIPLLLFIALTAPSIFPLIFGGAWTKSGTIVSLLTPLLYFQLVAQPLMTTIAIVEKQLSGAFWQASLLLASLTPFALSKGLWPIEFTLWSYAMACSVLHLALIWMALEYTNADKGKVFAALGLILIASSSLNLPLLVIKILGWSEATIFPAATCSVLFITIFFAALWSRRKDLF